MWLDALTLRLRNVVSANGPFGNHATLGTGLVSYWKLTEKSGTRADSVVATGNDLTDNNTVTSAGNSYPANMPGIVANFTAANSESLSRTNASLVNWPQGDFHVAFWGYRRASATEGQWISKADSASNQREWRVFTAGSQTRAYLSASPDGTNETVNTNTGDTTFPNVTWGFVEIRRSGTTIGVAINGGAFQDGSLSAVFNGTADFKLGARNNTPATFLDGLMVATGIWGRVLTAQERTDLYAGGAGLFY